MKICLGFYGFIRTNITHENVTLFLNTLPSNSVIDIYIYIYIYIYIHQIG